MIGFIRLISVGMVLHEVEIGSSGWVEGTKARRGEARRRLVEREGGGFTAAY